MAVRPRRNARRGRGMRGLPERWYGISPHAVNRRGSRAIMRDDRSRWDARYAAGDRRHDVGPAPQLAGWLPRLPPGRALDVAAGLGRHAVLLARHGWTVGAVDL